MSKYIILYGLGLISTAIILYVSTRLFMGLVKKKWFVKKEIDEEAKQKLMKENEESDKKEHQEIEDDFNKVF